MAGIEKLRDSVTGAVITPEDTAYDESRRVWNGMIDRRPRAIVRAAGVDDVAASVRFARENDWRVAVRGGGHNAAGLAVCDDGLVIDLSTMRGVDVDPQTKRPGPRAARRGATTTPRPGATASPPPAVLSRPPASQG